MIIENKNVSWRDTNVQSGSKWEQQTFNLNVLSLISDKVSG